MGLFEIIVDTISGDIIEEAFDEALSTMEGMVVNAGQEAVFLDVVVTEFENSLDASTSDSGWQPVDIGEYMDFMGEIVEAGNQIMEEAYDLIAEYGGEAEFDEDAAAELGEEYSSDFF